MGMLPLVFNIQPVEANPITIVVPDDYEKIQWAIGNASNGDTIFVRAGTYYENIFVSKTVSLIGENKNTTIIDGAGTTIIDSFLFSGGMFVFADDVKIANFTVRNGSYGIYIRGDHIIGNRVTVTDCVAYNNWFGLEMFQSSQNLLRRNLLFNNSYNLHIGEFWHINEFLHDIDTSNLVNGKPVYYLANKKNLSINPVSFPNIGYLGVVNSTNVRISDLSISRNGEGLLIAFSSDILIERIEATNNFDGIALSESPRTTIRHCNFSYNYHGIFPYYSDYVNIEENTISHNEGGIFLMGSNYGATYHNNFVENGLSPGFYQARAEQSYNCHWDDGYPYGGNYWSDYAGVDLHNGPYQNETGSDGIGDTPYIIDENNQDNYPLMNPWAPSVEPRTWTVDDDAPADFSLIQEAINAASPGDAIYVKEGIYYENVIVNKAVSLIGENKLTTTIDGNITGTVVAVTADNVAISGFTIRNGGDIYVGISLSSNGNNITNNIMSNNWCGISLEHYSAYNVIADNSIMNNLNGIAGELWSDTTIINNVLKDNLLGINTNYCDRNTIAFNNITNHWSQGIMIQFSSYNTIVGNYITDNNLGGFQEGGIYIGYSSYNKFFHNNIIANRVKQVEVRGSGGHPSVNTWDNGYPSGGNYWSDYRDRYPNATELDDSGIWNTPYVIDENNQDKYPLVEPWSLKPSNPVEATQELIETIETRILPKGTENSLKAKLKVAIHMLDLGKEDGAIRKLTAFINRVEMLREKTLTNEQADELVLEAQRIIDLING